MCHRCKKVDNVELPTACLVCNLHKNFNGINFTVVLTFLPVRNANMVNRNVERFSTCQILNGFKFACFSFSKDAHICIEKVPSCATFACT